MAPHIGVNRSGDDCRDAMTVGDAILKLISRLDLKTTLTEKGVGKDQADVITKQATRQESGPVYNDVKALVEALY